MPRWKVTVANLHTVEVEAETEDQAQVLAKGEADESVNDYNEQWIMHIEKLLEGGKEEW